MSCPPSGGPSLAGPILGTGRSFPPERCPIHQKTMRVSGLRSVVKAHWRGRVRCRPCAPSRHCPPRVTERPLPLPSDALPPRSACLDIWDMGSGIVASRLLHQVLSRPSTCLSFSGHACDTAACSGWRQLLERDRESHRPVGVASVWKYAMFVVRRSRRVETDGATAPKRGGQLSP